MRKYTRVLIHYFISVASLQSVFFAFTFRLDSHFNSVCSLLVLHQYYSITLTRVAVVSSC